MEVTISLFCLFIRVYDITYVDIQLNGQKHHRTLHEVFLHKTDKKRCKENQGRNVFYIYKYDVTYTESYD